MCKSLLQVVRNKLSEHYLTERHQRMLSHVLRCPPSHRQLTVKFHNRLSVAVNDAVVLERNLQRIGVERVFQENYLRVVLGKLRSCQLIDQKCTEHVATQNFVIENILSLKQHLEDRPLISFDGTLKWRINNVEEKMRMCSKEELHKIVF